ncbi:hypothetical protein SAMN04489810_3492 [Microbacterium pygmaeum]|uniref:Glycosyl transferase family 2 n=1 Tax=Microbacterium pygmaeum TaxID=370764 RepID=A0A1G8DZN6_9MICO|nr:hypothetical protein SAMN04489810_0005 [Microbacterium pygmaeum]SDH63078.1 hypothetical protein SAMN04489810_3492 [Microbacterium pygmaeum]
MSTQIVGRAQRRLAKLRRGMKASLITPVLRSRAARSNRSLVDESNDVVICLTSYGDRLGTVHLTVESIGSGRTLPGRLILWTDPGVDIDELPSPLRRMQARGLEIRPSAARVGSHTKYFPYVMSEVAHMRPLVTADDDSIYPRYWLARLQQAGASHAGEIVCYRAHRVGITPEGVLKPYNSWQPARDTEASVLNFATGVSGVYYPADFLDELRLAGDKFLATSPKADDVWLHYCAVANGRVIRQLGRTPEKYPELRATQETALHRYNTGLSANDSQIADTYSPEVLSVLRSRASV